MTDKQPRISIQGNHDCTFTVAIDDRPVTLKYGMLGYHEASQLYYSLKAAIGCHLNRCGGDDGSK